MSDDATETTETPTPEDPGVTPTQEAAPAGAAAMVSVLPAGANIGIQQSEMVAGIREAGSAFQTAAFQAILARWASEYDRRLTRCEEALAKAREEVASVREERARLDERLKTTAERNNAQDMLKIGGGAALALGLPLLVEGKNLFLGGISTIAGILLAYYGGARIPWWKRK